MSKIIPKKIISKNGLNILLRTPEVGEGAALIEVMKKVFLTTDFTLTQYDEFNYTPEQEDEILSLYLKDPKRVHIVPYLLENQEGTTRQIEKPIGMMNFFVGQRKRNSHIGSFGMSLLSEYRGVGIGTEMLVALIDWAKSTPGIEKVDLEVHAKNTYGIALYNKLGFQIEGRRTRAVKFNENQYDDVLEMSLFVK